MREISDSEFENNMFSVLNRFFIIESEFDSIQIEK